MTSKIVKKRFPTTFLRVSFGFPTKFPTYFSLFFKDLGRKTVNVGKGDCLRSLPSQVCRSIYYKISINLSKLLIYKEFYIGKNVGIT